jgi:hypothetical protein
VGTKLGAGGSSGYEALYSGRITSVGSYQLLGDYEYIWTATQYGDNAWRRCLSKYANDVGRWNTFPKDYGFSIRCIRDSNQFCSGCDVTPPTVPDGLQVTVEGNTISLLWNSSVDDSGVESYNIYNEYYNKIITVYDTIHVFTGLEYDSTYSFMITAVDSTGNESGESDIISATTVKKTDINDIWQDHVIIYPNPFNRFTTLQWNNPEGDTYTLYIMDLSGKICCIVNDIRTSRYILEKVDLRKGLYIVELKGPKAYSGKIVIE